MKSLEEAIIEYQNEDNFAIEEEEKKNVKLLTMSNSLKRAAKDKQSEFDNLLKQKAYNEEKNKHCVIIDANETELQYREKLIILIYIYYSYV